MANCVMCGVKHDRWRDRAHTVPASYCGDCHAEEQRENRRRYAEMTPEQRLRSNARAYANVYQRRGLLTAKPCERCGRVDGVQKHHDDYTKPLEVRWLCAECHNEEHYGPVVRAGVERARKKYLKHRSDGACPRCGGPREKARGYCKTCAAAYMRMWRSTQSQRKRNICPHCGRNTLENPKHESTEQAAG